MLIEAVTGTLAVMALFGLAWLMAWLDSRRAGEGCAFKASGERQGPDCAAGCAVCILEKPNES